MKGLVERMQKEVKSLQKTLEKEGNDLIAKAKKMAGDIAKNKNVAKTTKDLEKLIAVQVKKMEPAFTKFVGEVEKGAEKYGFDLKGMEKKVRTTVKKASVSLQRTIGGAAKKKTTKAKAKTVTKAPVKKAASRSTKKS